MLYQFLTLEKSILDVEFRLLKNLIRKNALDSIRFWLESRRNPLRFRFLALDSSKHPIGSGVLFLVKGFKSMEFWTLKSKDFFLVHQSFLVEKYR